MDASEIKTAAGETGVIRKAGGRQGSGGGAAPAPAQLNVKAASKYLSLLSRDRAQASDGLQRALNSVHSTLNSYIQDPKRVSSAAQASSIEGEGEFARLSSRVISRDFALSECVAEDLSTKSHLVRSRDASAEFEKTMGELPPALKEDTAAGAALSKAIAQSLLNLTDHQTLGAGLERDLAVRGVYVPEQELSQRSRDATSRILQVSLSFVKSNSPEELKEIPAEPEPVKEVPGSTTPQIMTRYLRQALDEFPDDSTYLDIFRKNKDAGAPQPDDKVSRETAERIHNLIAKAAETARRGNLIPGGNAQGSAAADSGTVQEQGAGAGTGLRASTSAAAPASGDARELSLSELSERASRLQRQFRLERQRLASEGQMPDPAEYPAAKDPAKATAEASKTSADTGKSADTAISQQTPESSTAKASLENRAASESNAETALPRQASSETAAKPQSNSASSTLSLEDASVSVSYKAVQNPFYGGISSAPGMTLPVNGFDDQEALGLAARSMVQDFSTPRTISRILKEQEALTSGQAAPESTASASIEAKAQPAADAQVQEPIAGSGTELPAGASAKTASAAGNATIASTSTPDEAASTTAQANSLKQASSSVKAAGTQETSADADTALSEDIKTSASASQKAQMQIADEEPAATEGNAEARQPVQSEPAYDEADANKTGIETSTEAKAAAASSSESKPDAASAAPESNDLSAAKQEASAQSKQQQETQVTAASSQTAAPASERPAEPVEDADSETSASSQSSKPQAAFVASSLNAETDAEAAEQEPAVEQTVMQPEQEESEAQAEAAAAKDNASAPESDSASESQEAQSTASTMQTRMSETAASAEDAPVQDEAPASSQSSKPQAAFVAPSSSAETSAESPIPQEEANAPEAAEEAASTAASEPEAEASQAAPDEAASASTPSAPITGDASEDLANAGLPLEEDVSAQASATQGVAASSTNADAQEDLASIAAASTKLVSATSNGMAASDAEIESSESATAAGTASSSAAQAAAAAQAAEDLSETKASGSPATAGLKASEAAEAFVAADENASAEKASDAKTSSQAQDDEGGDADAKAQSAQGSSIGDSIMKGTVPASELDDSDTPEDAPDNAGRNLGREAAGAIDTAREASSGEEAQAPADPLKAPAAAAVTTGGSAPVPQESVITNPQGTVREGGFLRRLASIFSPSKAAASAAASDAAAAQGAALQQMGRGSPLDAFASVLATMGASRFLPPEARKEARDLRQKLMDPVNDLTAVDSWLEFVAAPMSPSSPRAAAMHQWAFFILCLRFRELGKSVDKFLKKMGIDINADLPIDDMLLSHQDDEGAGEKLCGETLSQLSRLQQLAPQDAEGFFSRAIPLPPAYDGGREGRMGVRREKRKDGRRIWHLEFAFDLEKIGPVGIRAVASFPEIRLSYVAQSLEGLQALQSKVPELERQLEDLGLEPRSSSPRIGRVDAMERSDKAPDGMVDVDI